MFDEIVSIIYSLGDPLASGEYLFNLPIYDFTVQVIATVLTTVCFLLPFAFIIKIARRY